VQRITEKFTSDSIVALADELRDAIKAHADSAIFHDTIVAVRVDMPTLSVEIEFDRADP
jgi:hypothetical protein